MSEHSAVEPGQAWSELPLDDYEGLWTQFESLYGFRAGMTADR